jgi:hypothetical protein
VAQEAEDEAGERPLGPARAGAPRWVKVVGLVLVVLVVLAVVLVLVSGGEHGPGRHASSAVPVTSALRW